MDKKRTIKIPQPPRQHEFVVSREFLDDVDIALELLRMKIMSPSEKAVECVDNARKYLRELRKQENDQRMA